MGIAQARLGSLGILPRANGLAQESEACNPRTCPRSCAEPIARPPAAKPDEPGNQHRNRQSQPCDNRQNYGDLDRLQESVLHPGIPSPRQPRCTAWW